MGNKPRTLKVHIYLRGVYSISSPVRVSITPFPSVTLLFVQSLLNASSKMASDRFVKFTEAEKKSFTEEQETVNTKKKT